MGPVQENLMPPQKTRAIEPGCLRSNVHLEPGGECKLHPHFQTLAIRSIIQSQHRAMGSGNKVVAANEKDTVVIQRRCLRAARAIQPEETLTREMIAVLRPATPGAIMPYEIEAVIGTRALVPIAAGQELRWTMLGA